ncbi:TetR/AcrR family transcriptional regulator [Kineococcus sp. R86509]|uniref:TetR/AcrR family transcriptional regulator n=1 Tax=Kineococcus sp. R86509 TaxID=3093851 RepID=UPI0036D25094
MAPPRTRRDPAAKRDELIAAAARVVGRDGVAATTTRRIAEEAGVPLGTVHYWFASKDELVQEVALAHLREVQGAGRDVVPGVAGGPAEDALRRLQAALAAEESFDRGRRLSLYELTTWSLRSEGRAEIARQQYSAMREAARSVTDPWVRAHVPDGSGDVDPEVLAGFVGVFVDGLALAELADPEGTPAEELLQFFSRLMGLWIRDQEG